MRHQAIGLRAIGLYGARCFGNVGYPLVGPLTHPPNQVNVELVPDSIEFRRNSDWLYFRSAEVTIVQATQKVA